MTATATIEAINGDQIATRTDLLLVRARNARCRLSNNKAAFANDISARGTRELAAREAREFTRRALARGSQPSIPLLPDPDHTLFIRVRRVGTSTASAAVLATMFAIAIVLTSIL